jgi:hypothetical protein
MFRRSFFLLRLVDIEGVRVMKCNGWSYEYPVSVRTGGRRVLECGDIGKGEQTGEGALRGILQVQLEGVAGGGYWGSECAKGIFSWVLEFGGCWVSGGVQVVKCGEARGNKVVDVRDGTRGSSGPWDTYARQGVVPSVGVIISVKRVVEFKGRGHCAPRSDMMETVQMWETYYLNPWCSSPGEFVGWFGLDAICAERQDEK